MSEIILTYWSYLVKRTLKFKTIGEAADYAYSGYDDGDLWPESIAEGETILWTSKGDGIDALEKHLIH